MLLCWRCAVLGRPEMSPRRRRHRGRVKFAVLEREKGAEVGSDEECPSVVSRLGTW